MPDAAPSPDPPPPLLPNLLVLSDMHLGEASKDRTRIRYLKAAVVEDREFCAFLEHFQSHRRNGRPWCLLLAGDVFDFLALSLAPDPDRAEERYGFRPSPRERKLGLENSAAKTRWKLDRILDRHPAVLTYLADFVASGNELVFLRGNHDAELFWPEVQRALVRRLEDTNFGDEAVAEGEREAFCGRIGFRDWFFHLPGEIHVQHGHQYDEFCSLQRVLVPLRPGAEEHMELAPTAILIRYGISRVPGVRTHDKDEFRTLDYLRWLWRLPRATSVALVTAYFRVLGEQVRYWRGVKRADPGALQERQAAALRDEAERGPLSLPTLQAMDRLHATPGNLGYGPIVSSMFFDSIGALLFTPLVALLWLLVSPLPGWATGLGLLALVLGILALVRHTSRRRDTEVPPKLRRAAAALAPLVQTPWIAMGHSHRAERVELGRGAQYVNTGCWLHAEGGGHTHGPICDCLPTFLQVERAEEAGEPPRQLELLRWCTQRSAPAPWRAAVEAPREVPQRAPDAAHGEAPPPELPPSAPAAGPAPGGGDGATPPERSA